MRKTCASLMVIFSTTALNAEPIFYATRIDFDVKGSFLQQAYKNLGTKEAAAVVTGICAAFGSNCSQQAGEGANLIHDLYAKNNKDGGDYRGVWPNPDGYVVCKAKIDWKNTGIDPKTTFNTTIDRSKGLTYYVSVGSGGAEGMG